MTAPYEHLMGSAGPVSIEIKRTSVSAGDSATVIAAVSGKKIRVLQAVIATAAVVTLIVKSGTTALTGAMTLDGANSSPLVLPFSPLGWWETVAGEALVFTLSSAVQTSGSITYIEI